MEDIEHKRVAEQIKELVQIRDSYNDLDSGRQNWGRVKTSSLMP